MQKDWLQIDIVKTSENNVTFTRLIVNDNKHKRLTV